MKEAPENVDVDLSLQFCGMGLEHPILNGSGTFDPIAAARVFGVDELHSRFPFSAFVSKTITVEPRIGNPAPRIWETPAGMINSIGLPNRGLEGFCEHDLPVLARLPVPLIVSVMGTEPSQFELLIDRVVRSGEAAALELNISCPNVHSGLIVAEQPEEAASLVTRLKALTKLPLLVKLTPNVAAPEEVAVAATEAGADAICLINTVRAAAMNPATGRPWLGAGRGGLSGPAVKAIAIEQVMRVRAAVEVPIVGMGGIARGRDALDFFAAGATVVAVGTENFRDPEAASRVRSELTVELAKKGVGGISELGKRLQNANLANAGTVGSSSSS